MAGSDQVSIDILLKSRGRSEAEADAESIADAYRRTRESIDRAVAPPKIKASEYLEGLSQVKKILEGTSPTNTLDKMLKGGLGDHMSGRGQIPAFEDPNIDKILDASSGKAILDTLEQIDTVIVQINSSGVNPVVKDEVLSNLTRYRDMLTDANDRHKKLADEGGNKTEGFLGRYKYSLGLVAGALTAVYGFVKYSSVFGSAIDVLGASVGYLADSMLYYLIPAVMWLANMIIGLADWFNTLPDPIKAAIAALVGIGAVLLLLGGPIGTALTWLKRLALFLNVEMAAAAFSGAAGILRALMLIGIVIAGSYLLWTALAKSGVTDSLAAWVDGFKKQHPIMTAAIRLLFSSLLLVGTLAIDLFTGQWDRIPEHIKGVFKILLNDLATIGGSIVLTLMGLVRAAVGGIRSIYEGLHMDTTGIDKTIEGMDAAIKKYEEFQQHLISENQKAGAFNPDTQIPATDMDVLNGVTSSDQIKAYYDKLLKNAGVDGASGYDDIMKKYDGVLSDDIVGDSNKKLKDYTNQVDALTGSLNSAKKATDTFKDSTKSAMDATQSSVNSAVRSTGTTKPPNEVEREIQRRHERAMSDLKSHSKYAHDSRNDPIGETVSTSLSSSAPPTGNQPTVVIQAPQTDSKPSNVYITIQGYNKSAEQLADEIARIWNTKSRGNRI